MVTNLNNQNEWTLRIKTRMKELNITQEELAHKMGLSRAAITHYLAGRRIPPLKQFHKLAELLQTDPAWLQFGTLTNSSTLQKSPNLHRIPILCWDQIEDIKNIEKLDHEKILQWIPHLYTDQINCFALKIKGDSMTAPSGHMTSFREGDVVQFNASKQVEHNNFVIAILNDANEATFKQYVEDGGKKYLKPLNPQYPIIPIDKKTLICGVMNVHFNKEMLESFNTNLDFLDS